MSDLARAGVAETASLVATGEVSARGVVEQALGRIESRDRALSADLRFLSRASNRRP